MTKDMKLEKLGPLQKMFHGKEYALVVKDVNLSGYILMIALDHKWVELGSLCRTGKKNTKIIYVNKGDMLLCLKSLPTGQQVQAWKVKNNMFKYLGELK